MKIVDIQAKIVSLKRRKVFKIAFSQNAYSHRVYVQIHTDVGLIGMGEALPFAPVTGETPETVLAVIEYLKPSLIGLDSEDIAGLHTLMDKLIVGNSSAKAAIDMACYDLIGKRKNMPVFRLLGGKESKLITDITIGIDDPQSIAKEALERKLEGFRCLKIKCGIWQKDDEKALNLIREAVGDNIELRIDINQGYNKEAFLRALPVFERLHITEIEQPLPYYDYDGMKELKELSSIPIMMDESVHSPQQAAFVCRHDLCDVINIKLMKCGGIYNALKIADIAKQHGKNCIIGCMSESKLGISAATAVFVCKDNIVSADLDSHYSFTESENAVKGGFTCQKDELYLSETAGLGIELFSF